jgi:hypothetical protein
MPAAVRAAIDTCGDAVGPGDQIILNDPYAGGTHLNDVTLVAPCFVDGRIVGWAANRAHHADLGGMAPGSMPPENPRDVTIRESRMGWAAKWVVKPLVCRSTCDVEDSVAIEVFHDDLFRRPANVCGLA